MNVLIFEDEKYTSFHLSNLLKQCDNTIEVIAIIGSVKEGINWFRTNEMPDLIFQDIMLSDGNCFDIFDAVELSVPIIFTTAFSEYALQSFQVNSIDYLVKPYDINDIKRALEKFKKFKGIFSPPERALLQEILNSTTLTPKKRFLVKTGDNYLTINSSDIAFFMSDDGLTTATLFAGQSFIVDYSIMDVSQQMDTSAFFQVNRKVIINIESVKNIHTWFNSRLKVKLNPPTEDDIIVSRERVKSFKEWLDR